jgi:large subunit ribosomal protein L6
MSRIGKLPISLPDKVSVTVNGGAVTVKGPKGELSSNLAPLTSVAIEGATATVQRADDSRQARSAHGLQRALLANMVKGVSEGFERRLEINGVGYKAEVKRGFVRFDLGYSHPLFYELPEGVEVEVEKKSSTITLRGIDRAAVGSAAAVIRAFRPPEPYKGKGIKYAEEIIRRKAGKSGVR